MPHPYEDLHSHMMLLDWQSRHGYLKVERTKNAVWSYVALRMSPADFASGEATSIPPPPCIPLKDGPRRYKKRQLTLTSLFDEQRRQAACKR